MANARRINGRFMACFFGTLLVLGVATYAVHAYQIKRNAVAFLQQARAEQEQGRLPEAMKNYLLYLGYIPEDNDARYAYSQILEKRGVFSRGDWMRLYSLYEELLRRNGDLHDVRRKLATLELADKRYDSALKNLKTLRDLYPDDGELHYLTGLCYASRNLKAGDNETARGYFCDAIKSKPDLLESYTQLASLMRDRLKTEEDAKTTLRFLGKRLADDRPKNYLPNAYAADQVMELLVQQNPKSYQAHLLRAFYIQSRDLPPDVLRQSIEEQTPRIRDLRTLAGKELKEALDLEPDKTETILAAARYDMLQDRFAEARLLLQRGLKSHPAEVALYKLLADVEVRSGNLPQAIAALQDAGKKVPRRDRIGVLRYQGILLIENNQIKEAEDIRERLGQLNAPEVIRQELIGRIHVHKGEWAMAIHQLEDVRVLVQKQPEESAQVDLLLGRCYERLGEVDRALLHYQQALGAQPLYLPARIGLASALVSLGHLDDGLTEYQRIFEHEPSVGPELARLMLLRNRARPAGNPVFKDHEIQDVLKRAESANPDSTQVVIMKAQAEWDQRKPAEAQKLLRKALEKHPEKLDLWQALASVTGRPDNYATKPYDPKMLDVLTEAEKALGDRLELRLTRARFWMERKTGKDKQAAATAVTALKKLEEPGNYRDEDLLNLHRALGNEYFRNGDNGEAKRLWRQVADEDSKDLQVRLALFDLALQTGDTKAVGTLIQEIHFLEGDNGTLWRYGEACQILTEARKSGKRENLDKARVLLDQAAKLRPTWARVNLARGHLADLEGDELTALHQYQEAIKEGESNPLALRRVFALMAKNNMMPQAQRLMDDINARGKVNDPGLQKFQSALLANQGDYDQAIKLALEPVQKNSKDPRDYVWLAQLYWSAKRNDEAEKVFDQALKLDAAKEVPEAWVVFVQFLAQTNKLTKAQDILERARKTLRPELIVLTVAQCHEALRQYKEADKVYKEALEAKPNDLNLLRNVAMYCLRTSDLAKAEEYLRTLLKPETKSTQGDKAWARRGLAMRLAQTGDYRNFEEALELLDENIHSTSGTMEDARTKAMILANRPGRRQEAIKLLESVIGQTETTTEERFLMAKLYEADGNWTMASRFYSALAGKENNPAYLAFCALTFLSHEEISDARLWFRKLKDVERDSLRTLEVEVRLLKAEGKGDQAAAKLSEYLKTPKADERVAAALYEKIGQTDEAKRLYQKLARDGNPQHLLWLAEFLGRNGELKGTLDLCEQAWKAGGGDAKMAPNLAEYTAAVALAALYTTCGLYGQPEGKEYKRIEKLLDEGQKANPKSLTLMLHRASLYNLWQDYLRAEQQYNLILTRDPNNALSLNNLAWMLAVCDGKDSQGLEMIHRAIELVGPLAEFLDTEAIIRLRQGKTKEALELLNAAVNDTPTANMYFHLAQAQHVNKDGNAVVSFRKAQKMNVTRTLHPLERDAYTKLARDLGERAD
jgi:tetratricopeptide (TPR) repeat protein